MKDKFTFFSGSANALPGRGEEVMKKKHYRNLY